MVSQYVKFYVPRCIDNWYHCAGLIDSLQLQWCLHSADWCCCYYCFFFFFFLRFCCCYIINIYINIAVAGDTSGSGGGIFVLFVLVHCLGAGFYSKQNFVT